jgi:1-phosphofructokinase/tagatose 6-phosphate kinase
MIITVTLNAALDKTLEVPIFTLGRRHRTVDQETMPGGKGVNIARAIKRLGQPVIATGLTGGATGTRIVEALNDESILNGFVRIREESRTNTAVLDPTTGQHTEINERGPSVSAQEMELFRENLLYLAKGASICVFAGSLPRGVDPGIYSSLIREVSRLGVTTILDTEGEPLRLGVRAEPDVISPNELEGEELVGHEFNDGNDRAQAVIEMTRLGAGEAIMTVSDGCYARVMEDGTPTLHRVRVAEQQARSATRTRCRGRVRAAGDRGPNRLIGRCPKYARIAAHELALERAGRSASSLAELAGAHVIRLSASSLARSGRARVIRLTARHAGRGSRNARIVAQMVAAFSLTYPSATRSTLP